MMFQAVLFTVIAYLVACYAYGLFLLWKLYTGHKFHGEDGMGEHLEAMAESIKVDSADSSSPPGYETPAKAA